jgi:hypothetical protein
VTVASEIVITGGLSSSVIVPMPWLSVSVALTGSARLTKKLSSGSSIPSLVVTTVTVRVVWFGAKTRLPPVAV